MQSIFFLKQNNDNLQRFLTELPDDIYIPFNAGRSLRRNNVNYLVAKDAPDNYSVSLRDWIDSLNIDKTYTHIQTSSSSTWTITHNLNKYPSITVIDSSGNVAMPDISYTDSNTVVLTFTPATSGTAYLN